MPRSEMDLSLRSPGMTVPVRPGDRIRQAQQDLAHDIQDRIAEFNLANGVTVAAIHVEYVAGHSSIARREGKPIVRLTLET